VAVDLDTLESVQERFAPELRLPLAAGGPVENEEAMKQLNRAYRLLMDYCGNYRCSFREEDVTRTYPDEEYWKKFRERWFDSI